MPSGFVKIINYPELWRKLPFFLQFPKTVVNLQSRFRRGIDISTLRYGVMVALQILALSVRVRILLSQQPLGVYDGGVAQLVRASDS